MFDPHKFRCETCEFNLYSENQYIGCERSEELLVSKNAQAIIRVVGCLSHSSLQSELGNPGSERLKALIK